ncbi:ribosomal-processing cysteine protease Prp [Fundicoccus ignavus]|nr:ribosomal-processing cysteine protease Prp [Fundicoccus ignavus]
MIKIKVFKDEKNLIKQIELTGHAGYADSGYDIVCAAVSSQVISVENSLHQLLNIAVETEVNEVEGGYLKLTMPVVSDEKLSENGQLLLNHLVFALQVLSQNYSEFIKIQEKTFN